MPPGCATRLCRELGGDPNEKALFRHHTICNYGSAGGAKVRPPPAARAPTRAQQGADELRRLLLTCICGPSVLTRRHARVVAGRTNDMELLPTLRRPRAGPAPAPRSRGANAGGRTIWISCRSLKPGRAPGSLEIHERRVGHLKPLDGVGVFSIDPNFT